MWMWVIKIVHKLFSFRNSVCRSPSFSSSSSTLLAATTSGEISPFIVIICISLFCFPLSPHLPSALPLSCCQHTLPVFLFILISVFFFVFLLWLFLYSLARQKSTQFRMLLNTRMFYSSSYRKDLRNPIVVVAVTVVTVEQKVLIGSRKRFTCFLNKLLKYLWFWKRFTSNKTKFSIESKESLIYFFIFTFVNVSLAVENPSPLWCVFVNVSLALLTSWIVIRLSFRFYSSFLLHIRKRFAGCKSSDSLSSWSLIAFCSLSLSLCNFYITATTTNLATSIFICSRFPCHSNVSGIGLKLELDLGLGMRDFGFGFGLWLPHLMVAHTQAHTHVRAAGIHYYCCCCFCIPFILLLQLQLHCGTY